MQDNQATNRRDDNNDEQRDFLAIWSVPVRCMLIVFAVVFAACATEPAATSEPADTTAADVDPSLVDLVDATCGDKSWAAPTMGKASVSFAESIGANHLWEPEKITYEATPPSSGNHRPSWAKWGHYSYLPPQRWLHNLEHGGIALLYHPCAEPAVKDKLLQYAKAAKPSAGDLLWVLTPYPGLPAAAAAVAWENVMLAETVTHTELDDFVEKFHRKGPEDVGMSGQYSLNWIE
jgi:hypothetical protein